MTKGKILVAGAVANKAGQGGEAWVRLNWVLGLRKLGFDVLFLEELGSGAPAAGTAYFRTTMERHGLADTSALIANGEVVCGMDFQRVLDFASGAEALINISGHLSFEPVMERVRRRVYVDIDPGFTQIWHAQGATGLGLEKHDLHFTIGENIGAPDCPIPSGGFRWRTTRPPIVLDEWPAVAGAAFDRFTTIANWRGSYGPVEFEGRTYGLKVHEFRKFIELPSRTPGPFELALNIHAADAKDREALERHGWRIVPPAVASRPEDFKRYIQQAGAEFSVAQGMYVQTQSGWFSDRTAVFLASGKPALVQDTGFSRHLPTGAGLVAFRTLDEAVAGAAEITAHYERHCAAAREIAETHFDSAKILNALLAEITT